MVALLVPLACLSWAFWPTFLDLAMTWRINPQYSHGWLVPVFAAFLLWSRRKMLDPAALAPSWWGVPVLAIGVGIRLAGGFFYLAWLDPLSLLPTLLGIGMLIGGMAFLRWAWPAVLFLGFMIPLPYSLAIALSGPLQHVATVISTFIMQVCGLPALAEGNVILLNENQINIAEACSGLSMLMVFVAMSAGMAIVVKRPLLDRLIIFGSAIPIAILTNVIRVTTTGILYETVNGETAHTFFHDVAGLMMPAVALGILAVEMAILRRLFILVPAVPARAAAVARQKPMAARPPRARNPAMASARERFALRKKLPRSNRLRRNQRATRHDAFLNLLVALPC